MNLRIDKDSSTPLYIQLFEQIRNIIQEENLDNEKLPSIRKLSKEIGVNNSTIINAYKMLEQEGYVYSIEGSGTYVKKAPFFEEFEYVEDEDMSLMVSGILPLSKNSINFASVSPTPDLFPIKQFKEALNEVLDRDAGHAFLYPEINGYEPLRESIADFLWENYHMKTSLNQIFITSGSQQALDIISKSMINQGDIIFVENPTYSGAISIFQARGARIIGIPMLEDGIDMDLFKQHLKRYTPKFLYMMTNFQSPTTYSYSDEKKAELLKLAREHRFQIIEDDVFTDLSFNNNDRLPLKADDKNDLVIYIKSFSKVFMPGIRIGFFTVPRKLIKEVIKSKHTQDITSSGFLQRAFDLYLRKNYWKYHIDKVKTVYTEKYNIMVNSLERLKKYDVEFVPPNGGLSLWIKLPKSVDSARLYSEAVENGLSLVPGNIFFVDDSIYDNYIRLSFSAVDKEDIPKGIRIIEDIISNNTNNNENRFLPLI